MITLATMYNLMSVVLTTAINVSFEAFFVMGLVYAVNMNTGIYKNLSDLSTEFADFRKVFWNSLESDVNKEKGTTLKELEEEIKILKTKVSKLKKLYLASNDVIEKLDERLRNIEDELDEEYNEDGSGSSSDEDNDTSSEEKKNKNKNKK